MKKFKTRERLNDIIIIINYCVHTIVHIYLSHIIQLFCLESVQFAKTDRSSNILYIGLVVLILEILKSLESDFLIY